jgi:hypothetical protein
LKPWLTNKETRGISICFLSVFRTYALTEGENDRQTATVKRLLQLTSFLLNEVISEFRMSFWHVSWKILLSSLHCLWQFFDNSPVPILRLHRGRGYVINRILDAFKFIAEFIEHVEWNNMLARGSHNNIILFNSCNKFNIELIHIQYSLYISPSKCKKKYFTSGTVNTFCVHEVRYILILH